MKPTNDIGQLRRRRLGVLASVTLLMAAAVTSLWLYRHFDRQSQAAAARQAGIKAYSAGNYPLAIDRLGWYITHAKPTDDAEALYDFAQARLKIKEPDHSEVAQAIAILQQAVRQDVTFKNAAAQLAGFYLLSGQNQQALLIADRLLAKQPKNKELLADRAESLARLSRTDKALLAARRAIKADPGNLEMMLLSYQLRLERGTSANQLAFEAASLGKKHPHDARYALLQAYAWSTAGDNPKAVKWLHVAAEQATPQAGLVKRLLTFLNQAQMYQTALTLLERTADQTKDASLRRELTQRLFDRGEDTRVVARIGKLDLKSPAVDAQLAGMKAVSLYRLGKPGASRHIAEQLLTHTSDAEAMSWGKVIEAITHTGSASIAKVATACRTGLKTLPRESYFHDFLGDALAQMGEDELALSAWSTAARLRPSWAEPRWRRAQTFLAIGGHTADAVKAARDALQRRPGNMRIAVTYLTARIAGLRDPVSEPPDDVNALMTRIEKASPHEPGLLEAKVQLLTKMGRPSAAAEAIEQALKWKPGLNQPQLMQLATLSDQLKLSSRQACYQAITKRFGPTPEVALADAVRLARAGQPKAGKTLLAKAKATANHSESGGWLLAWAHYLDVIGDKSAKAAWLSLARDYPNNARVQEAALASAAMREDRTAQTAMIDRLKAIGGSQAAAWKIARARWLLQGAPDPRDVASAIVLLQQVIDQAGSRVEPRMLLAMAHETLHQWPLAIRSLQAAIRLDPDSVDIRLALARDQQRTGQFAQARQTLTAAAAKQNATAAQVQQAGSLLARQGNTGAAIDILTRAQTMAGKHDASVTTLLASLYAQRDMNEQAATLCKKIVAHPSAPGLLFAARFYASQGDAVAATGAIAKLSSLKLPPGHVAMMRGLYFQSQNARAKARTAFDQAVTAAPKDSGVWQAAIALDLSTNQARQAIAKAKTAAANVQSAQGRAGFEAIIKHADAVKLLAHSQFQPLVLSLMNDEEHRQTAGQALELLRAGEQGHAGKALATQMANLAGGHEDFLALQNAAAETAIALGDPQDAASIATRATERFPAAAQPAELAARAQVAMQDWSAALVSAKTWRARQSGSKETADMIIANAQVQLNLPRAAVRTLRPYAAEAISQPDRHDAFVTLYTQALVQSHEADKAAKILAPLLMDSTSRWRLLWLNLAAYAIDDPAIAANWLAQLQPTIPAQSAPEHIALARAWWAIAKRAGNDAYRRHAMAVIDSVVQSGHAPPQAWLLRGLMAEAATKLNIAKASYEKALKLDAKLLTAKNNLAMILLHQHDNLDLAMQLARQAARADPKNANFLDTLAQVQTAQKQYATAIHTIEKAIELEPHQQQWKDRLAAIKRAEPKTVSE